jgi:type II secretory pathway pseudopilin PulG
MKQRPGYTFLILMVMITILVIGLMAAVPIWKTQVQRESEEELIFRGGQYVEAVRLFQKKNPGRFPASIEEMIKARCLRKPFPDPMTRDGKWDVILQAEGSGPSARPGQGAGQPGRAGSGGSAAPSVNRVFIVPEESLDSVQNPRILGVVSRSTRTSIRLYRDQDVYSAWLFFYGQAPDSEPDIIRFGRPDK